MKVVEVTVLAFLTTSFAFWLPLTDAAICLVEPSEVPKNLVRYNCPSGYYNPMATLLFNTEGMTIRALLLGNQA
jgi:hypothetical protein